ncbi:MAG: glycosyltransferase family 39 protein, partial [Sphingomonas sp.]|nr:glycosyltransferase family 39 protein [Sphingomonas sp.]
MDACPLIGIEPEFNAASENSEGQEFVQSRPTSKDDIDRGTARALLAITIGAAAALRLFGANDQLWFDEIATLLDSVRKPLGVIMTHFPSDNDHVFYSVLAHISVNLGGETPFMLRLPAILFGIASIPLIYTVGTRVTTRFEAVASAMVATVAGYHIWFSQNARGYTMLLVLTLLGTQLIFDALKTR